MFVEFFSPLEDVTKHFVPFKTFPGKQIRRESHREGQETLRRKYEIFSLKQPQH